MIQALSTATPFSVRQVCLVMEVSVSGFYAHKNKAQRVRRQEDEQIISVMREVFEASGHSYGSVRLVKGLRKWGLSCGKTRVRRLMKQHGLCPKQKRRFRVQTTRSNPHLPVAPNLAALTPPPTRPGQSWKSDITYIPTKEGFLYLGATLDAFSRRCAGWCARDNMETSLVRHAAQMAFGSSPHCEAASIHHSDRGSQYASEPFRLLLQSEQITQSMSRKGNCYDNAMMESFWATLKTECFDNFRDAIPETRQQAQGMIFRYIELFYNRERFHSALDYLSPVQFENNWTKQHLTVQRST
jgi:transposase InsO family protein